MMSDQKTIRILDLRIFNLLVCLLLGVAMVGAEEKKVTCSFSEEQQKWESYFNVNNDKFAYLLPIPEETKYFEFVTQKMQVCDYVNNFYVIVELNCESGILNTYLLVQKKEKKYDLYCWDSCFNESRKKVLLKSNYKISQDFYYYTENEKLIDGTTFYIFNKNDEDVKRACLYTKFTVNKNSNKLTKLFDLL